MLQKISVGVESVLKNAKTNVNTDKTITKIKGPDNTPFYQFYKWF